MKDSAIALLAILLALAVVLDAGRDERAPLAISGEQQ